MKCFKWRDTSFKIARPTLDTKGPHICLGRIITPPAYTISNPCLSIPIQPELNHYKETEKEWRLKEEKREQKMSGMKNVITQAVQSVQSSKKITGLEYEDLCMHSDLEIPEGYKI